MSIIEWGLALTGIQGQAGVDHPSHAYRIAGIGVEELDDQDPGAEDPGAEDLAAEDLAADHIANFAAKTHASARPVSSANEQGSQNPVLSDDRARAPAGASPLPTTLSFLMEAGFPAEVLHQAAIEARRLGTCPVVVLLSGGGIDARSYYRALARHLGLPFLSDPITMPGLPADAAIRAGHAPLAPDRYGAQLRMLAAPSGAALARLVDLASRSTIFPAGLALTDPARFEAAVIEADAARIAQQAARELADRHPRFSYRGGAWVWQKHVLVAGLTGVALLPAGLPPDMALALISILICFMSAFLALLRIAACRERVKVIPKSRPPALDDAQLPDYSIVVALYREAAVADQLCAAIAAIDYPPARLDVIFVVEQDDPKTREVLLPHAERCGYRIIVAPDGQPRTKPRALNVALPLARGAHLVIFDAEDIPEPGQLRLAAETFAVLDPETVCLQARLAIDNDADGILPGCFAVEYAALFDVINPGSLRLGLPVPLGGTSNHFRVAALRAACGWDAWNVTEDADLGLRLAHMRLLTADLPATTWEEAPVGLRAWHGQRKRWMKGFLQTAITHTRDPLRALRAMGLVRYLAVLACTFGAVFAAMAYPLFFITGIAMLATPVLLALGHEPIWLDWFRVGIAAPHGVLIFAVAGVTFCLGVAATLGPALIGVIRRARPGLLARLPLLPFYYLLVSAAAWCALRELFTDATGWHKTPHGAGRRRSKSRALKPQTFAGRAE